MLFLPESPRFLMHEGKTLASYKVWKRIRGISCLESRQEYFAMASAVQQEESRVQQVAQSRRFPWMDLIT